MSAEEVVVVEDFPLHQAVIDRNEALVRELIKKAADKSLINKKDKRGHTPLHYAAMYGNLDIVKCLVSHDPLSGEESLIHTKDNTGCTPLHYAAMLDWPDIVRYLVDKGASVNDRDNKGRTPLYDAARRGWSTIVAYLAAVDPSNNIVNVPNGKGRTPIQAAFKARKVEVVVLLIEKGATLENGINVNVQDEAGRTPLDFAKQHRLSTAIGVLEKASAADKRTVRRPVNRVLVPVVLTPVKDQKSGLDEFLRNLKGLSFDIIGKIRIEKNVEGILASEIQSAVRDSRLLLLCRQALWIDANYPKEGYSFFDVAVESLAFGSEELKKTEEYWYLKNMKAERNNPDRYRIMSTFDDVVQKARFLPQDKEKAYKWANKWVDDPPSCDEKACDKVPIALSSKGEAGKIAAGLFGHVIGSSNIAVGIGCIILGVIGVVISLTSVGAALGVSVPVALPTLWLSSALIGVGLVAILIGTTAKDIGAKRCERTRQAKDNWERVCTGVKTAFWPPAHSVKKPPEGSPSLRREF